MKPLIKIISFIGLLFTIVPSVLVFYGSMEFNASKNFMILGTVIWFLSAPLWMNKKEGTE